MDFPLLNVIIENYNIGAALLGFACVVILTRLGKFLVFRIPACAKMREHNREYDKTKLAMEKYPPTIKASMRVGLYCNLTFLLLILPFCISLQAQSLWQILLHIVAILMVYDFFYYLMHRFWFHGSGKMRLIHAVHHQARSPTYVDAQYVHPLETFCGLSLFFLCVAGMSALLGPFHIATLVITYVIYVQLNTINHTYFDLDYFPFKTVNYITAKHHLHHENMNMGNYSTFTLLYDKIFGTYE